MTIGITHPRVWQVLDLLSDGEFHSGEVLAEKLGISRASIFNALAEVTEYGVTLQRIRGRGYRLARPWQRLDSSEISRWMGKSANQFSIEVLSQATSSNSVLLQRAALGAPSGTVLAVELQTAGRGRMGRVWYAGLGDSLTFSLLWRFDRGLNALSGLSLVVGVAMVQALKKLGAQGVHLKWPNDILTAQGKMAGVLIEAQGDVFGPSLVVIGIGMNCSQPSSYSSHKIEQPVSSLEDICAELPSRNQLLAVLLQALSAALNDFSSNGFASQRVAWEQLHYFQNKLLKLHLPDGTVVSGISRGVNERGELCLESSHGIQHFNSGEIEGLKA